MSDNHYDRKSKTTGKAQPNWNDPINYHWIKSALVDLNQQALTMNLLN